MKKQQGLTLIEMSIVIGASLLVIAGVVAGAYRVNERSATKGTLEVSLELLDKMVERQRLGMPNTMDDLVAAQVLPQSMVRGTAGAYNFVLPNGSIMISSPGSQLTDWPSTNTSRVWITGLSSAQCEQLSAQAAPYVDQILAHRSAGYDVVMRHSATEVKYTQAGARVACGKGDPSIRLLLDKAP